MTDMSGILDEFKDINFDDKRLNNRFGEIMKSLETSPSGLISKAFVDAKDQKAAYRFLDNTKASFQKMLLFHQQRVKQRCKAHGTILAIQDSTSILLNGAKKASGIGKIGDLNRDYPGLNIHTSLLATPQQEILGISNLEVFDRRRIGKRSKFHDKLPASQKETGRWLRGITDTREQVGADVKLVWIADREGDFWDYFSQLNETQELFVQRVVHKRAIAESKEDYFAHVKKQPVIGHHTFEVDSRGGAHRRSKRIVRSDIRTSEITFKKPKKLPREMKTFSVRAIHVMERDSDSPLEWFLITNIPCDSFEEILEKVRWYQTRWLIEELHRIVKSGCGVEEMRLGHRDNLTKYLLLLFVVSMRILWMTKLSRHNPEALCTEAFSEEEWQILYIRKYKKRPADNWIPSVKEAVGWLAILGGFYEYNKRVPGPETIWRGIKRLKGLISEIETIQKMCTRSRGALKGRD